MSKSVRKVSVQIQDTTHDWDAHMVQSKLTLVKKHSPLESSEYRTTGVTCLLDVAALIVPDLIQHILESQRKEQLN